ncbi:MAG: hypothetical protein ING36_13550 [Burkholderiales bacterium]|jgi:hypothetical protein|nr:hypothetical protein [Burkholderiales bacterium]
MKFFLPFVSTLIFFTSSVAHAQVFSTPYYERFPGTSAETIRVLYVRHEGVGGIYKGEGVTKDLLEHGYMLCSNAMSAKGLKAEPLDWELAEKYSRRIYESYLASSGWVLNYRVETNPAVTIETNCKVVADIRAVANIIRPLTPACHYVVLDERNSMPDHRSQKNNAGAGCGLVKAQPTSFIAPDSKQRAALNSEKQQEKCIESNLSAQGTAKICRNLSYPTMDAVLKTGSLDTQYPVISSFESHILGKLLTRYSAVRHEEIDVRKDFFSLPAGFRLADSQKR